MKALFSNTLAGLFALSILLVVTGCNHTRILSTSSPDALAEINNRAAQATATVTMNSGQRVAARSLSLSPDVMSWIDQETGEAASAPTSDLQSVQFRSRGKGTLEGLGLGVLIGSAVGAAIGLVAHDSSPPPCTYFCFRFSRGEEALIVAFVFGVPGAAIGGLVGAGRGSRTEYTVPDTRHP